MKQAIISRLNNFQRRTGFQWGGGELILAGILIIGILSLGSGMFGRWLRASREGGLLMVDLHSFSSADYGVDEMPVSVPAIGLEIIQDLLGMKAPPETGRPSQIALVTPSPTPTLPWTGVFPATPTPGEIDPGESTPTDQPRNTATPAVNRTSTPTPTAQVPVGTDPPQEPSSTAQPSATPTAPAATNPPQPTNIPATNTPVPTPQLPTNTPLPSPTPQPAVSPTPRPTRSSSTLAVTPTAKYTPVVTSGPPQLP